MYRIERVMLSKAVFQQCNLFFCKLKFLSCFNQFVIAAAAGFFAADNLFLSDVLGSRYTKLLLFWRIREQSIKLECSILPTVAANFVRHKLSTTDCKGKVGVAFPFFHAQPHLHMCLISKRQSEEELEQKKFVWQRRDRSQCSWGLCCRLEQGEVLQRRK